MFVYLGFLIFLVILYMFYFFVKKKNSKLKLKKKNENYWNKKLCYWKLNWYIVKVKLREKEIFDNLFFILIKV